MPTLANKLVLLTALVVLLFGAWLRLSPSFAGALGAGYDERLYSGFLNTLRASGSYPELVRVYLAGEADVPEKRVSPLRCLTLLQAWPWALCSGRPSYQALLDTSAATSILTLLASGLFARRLGGNKAALALMAMMAVAPLQIFNAHRTLVDGNFSFWMLLMMWSLWECLERPDLRWPPWLLGASWAPVLMCKETSLFVWLGTLLVLGFVRTSQGRRAARPVWLAVTLGPSLGLLSLVALCGGLGPFRALMVGYVSKQIPAYTMVHADGPWWGYLLAMLILSPLVSLLGWAAALGEAGRCRSGRFMLWMMLGALVPLSCLDYQIVPRLLTLADFPLRWLCWLQLLAMTERLAPPRARWAALGGLLLLLCALDLRHFYIVFQQHGVYEPTCDVLLWAVKVVPNL